MSTIDELMTLDGAGLMRALESGHPIDPTALDDTEYRGVSLGLPSAIERLSWKTFKKVFHRDPETGALRGWNVRIEQTGDVHGPYVPMTRKGQPHTFGHYRVVDAEGFAMPCRAQGLLIHYGLGDNPPLDPVRRLRDPLVALERGSAELLLGWSYVDLGIARVRTPSFFVLRRDCALTHVA